MKFSEKLMNLRKTKGMSQEELATKLNVTRQTVSKWELDQTAPDMNKLMEISKLFEISLDELTNNIGTTGTENTYDGSLLEKKNTKLSITIFVIGLIVSLIFCGIGLIVQAVANNTNEERRIQAEEISNKKVAEIEKNIQLKQDQIEELKTKKNESNNKNVSTNAPSTDINFPLTDINFSSMDINNSSSIFDNFLDIQEEIMDTSKEIIDTQKEPIDIQEEIIDTQKEPIDIQKEIIDTQKGLINTPSSDLNYQIETLTMEIKGLEAQKNIARIVIYETVKPITYNIFYYIAAGIFTVLSLTALIYFLATRRK